MKKKKPNYWTEMGLAAKEALQSQKIMDSRTKHYRHPRLEDLVFKKNTQSLDLTESEWKEKFAQEKSEKAKRFESLPFSEKHNKLVLRAYAGHTDDLKRAAERGAHEERIKRIMLKDAMRKTAQLWSRQNNYPYLLVVQQRFKKDGKEHDSMVIPSANKFETLYDIGLNMSKKLTAATDTFTGIEIWKREDYIGKMKGDKTKLWSCYIPTNPNRSAA